MKNIAKPLDSRVDIVTSKGVDVIWHEVKSLAYNTKRENIAPRPSNFAIYSKALTPLDLPNIATEKLAKLTEEELAGTGETTSQLKVRANQFYAKEFFIDRVYAGGRVPEAKNRMRWVFHDFSKDDMNTYAARSSAKPKSLVVGKETFLQCGIQNACAAYKAGHSPLTDVRQKLVNGIKKPSSTAVIDIMLKTFPQGAFVSEDDVEDYMDEFKLQPSNLIHSEKASDWLQTSLGDALTSACENN